MGTPGIVALLLAAQASPPADPPDRAEDQRPSGLTVREDCAFDGFTLFAPLRDTKTYLIDMSGRVVHTWESPVRPGNAVIFTERGTLVRCLRESNEVMGGGGQGGRILELDWNGRVLWDWSLNDERHMAHHDVARLANGDLLVIAWEYHTQEEALAVGRDPEQLTDAGFWPDVVLQVRPVYGGEGQEPGVEAEVVWKWRAWDHLVQDRDPELARYGSPAEHPGRIDVNGEHRLDRPLTERERAGREEQERAMRALGYVGDDDPEGAPDGGPRMGRGGDWLHTNAIDHRADLDLIVLSVRRFDEVWVIDHSTTEEEARGSTGGRFGRGGELLARHGNPRAHGAGESTDRVLFGQHDARWIPVGFPGEGNLTLFNNGDDRPAPRHSTVEELTVDLGALERGAPLAPIERVWSYAAPDPGLLLLLVHLGCRAPAQRQHAHLRGREGVACLRSRPRARSSGSTGTPTEKSLRPRASRGPGAEGTERPRRRGGPNMAPGGLFRATRLAPDHPGLRGRGLGPP